MGVYVICLGCTRFFFVHPHYNKIIYDFFNEHPKLNKCRFQGVIKNTKRHFYYQRSIPPNILFWHMLINIQDAEKNLLPVGSLLTESPSLLNVMENFMPILFFGLWQYQLISLHIYLNFHFSDICKKETKCLFAGRNVKSSEIISSGIVGGSFICISFFSAVFQKLWFLSISELWLRGLVSVHFKTLVWTTFVRVCFCSRCARDNILGGMNICC